MEFIKSWKFAVIVFLVLAVLATAGIIYGVKTHTEAGLMQDAPQWHHMPLRVTAVAYAPDTETSHEVADAQNVLNRRLGFTAFEARDARETYDVQVTLGVPAETGWMDPGGDTRFLDGNNGLRCEIRTSNVSGELLALVLQHELGHCLGLAHDDFSSSIMRRAQSPTPAGAFPPNITDFDRALLVRLYGPRHVVQ